MSKIHLCVPVFNTPTQVQVVINFYRVGVMTIWTLCVICVVFQHYNVLFKKCLVIVLLWSHNSRRCFFWLSLACRWQEIWLEVNCCFCAAASAPLTCSMCWFDKITDTLAVITNYYCRCLANWALRNSITWGQTSTTYIWYLFIDIQNKCQPRRKRSIGAKFVFVIYS